MSYNFLVSSVAMSGQMSSIKSSFHNLSRFENLVKSPIKELFHEYNAGKRRQLSAVFNDTESTFAYKSNDTL